MRRASSASVTRRTFCSEMLRFFGKSPILRLPLRCKSCIIRLKAKIETTPAQKAVFRESEPWLEVRSDGRREIHSGAAPLICRRGRTTRYRIRGLTARTRTRRKLGGTTRKFGLVPFADEAFFCQNDVLPVAGNRMQIPTLFAEYR